MRRPGSRGRGQNAGAIVQRRRSPAIDVDFVILVCRHSSSDSRFTARASGFMIFTHTSVGRASAQLLRWAFARRSG
jgi:hypothetical protein